MQNQEQRAHLCPQGGGGAGASPLWQPGGGSLGGKPRRLREALGDALGGRWPAWVRTTDVKGVSGSGPARPEPSTTQVGTGATGLFTPSLGTWLAGRAGPAP